MAYCKNCGSQMEDGATFCTSCGASQSTAPAPVVDNGGFGWGLLGCCVPIVGLILFLVWKDSKPKSSKALASARWSLCSALWCCMCCCSSSASPSALRSTDPRKFKNIFGKKR